MQPKSIYIASSRPRAGSLIVSMGLMEMLKGRFESVAYFRPIVYDAIEEDGDVNFMIEHFSLQIPYQSCIGFTLDAYVEAYAENREEKLFEVLFKKIDKLHESYDFILMEGFPRTLLTSALDFDLNLEIAKNLDTAFVSVLNAKNRSTEEILNEIHINAESIREEECSHLATFVNRCDPGIVSELREKISGMDEEIYIMPEVKDLDTPIVREVKEALGAELLIGSEEQLDHLVQKKKIAAMGVENYLQRISDGSLVIVPGDRADILLATMLSFYGKNHPNVSGVILSGGLQPSESIVSLISDMDENMAPILSVQSDSYQTAIALDSVQAQMRPQNIRKITLAKGIFDEAVDKESIAEKFRQSTSEIITPMMFEYRLFERARKSLQRIVLPESGDERILKATEILLRRGIVEIILLGNAEEIKHFSSKLRLDISKASIVDPNEGDLKEKFAQKFYELRKAKGLTIAAARDALEHPNYFATMMLYEGLADGMVSGATHTTADTVRPALQIIKTKPGISIVSSIFFMCLETKVLVYGDCAVNLDPNSEELAQIAISSAETAQKFGIEPRVAMLSYSTGDSGSGPDVEKVREAAKIAKSKRPDLLIEGPIQYDAAIDEKVAAKKLPGSKVAGRATVFIFPDLNTGNNTYKAVQRSTGALAIGPVLQGLKLPVNDLSRGCLVDDIVNTVAITAIQAQSEDEK